jgi:hypothetical protein
MRSVRRRQQAPVLAFEVYGAGVAIAVEDPELMDRIEARLPSGHRRVERSGEMAQLMLRRDSGQGFDVLADGVHLTASAELEVALRVLDAQIRREIALRSREGVFVQAGVVAHRGQAILLPGPSISGKTTLVAALVRAGASFYSDKFAVLDDEGCVHPFPKAPSVRAGERLPVGMIVVTHYRPRRSFQPERRSLGQGALALVGNAVPARDRPAEVMASARRAAEGALVLEGDRGEAESAAREILGYSARPSNSNTSMG